MAVLGKGKHFGEMALESRQPRSASIIAKTDCDLAVLTFDSFRVLMTKHLQKIKEDKVSFLKKNSLLSDWSIAGLQILYNNTEKIVMPINSVIYKEGD